MRLSQEHDIYITQISPEEKKIIEELNDNFRVLFDDIHFYNQTIEELFTQFMNILSGYSDFNANE